MGRSTPIDELELDAQSDPVVEVTEPSNELGAVDVATESGFTFRFQRMSGGLGFDDGYVPGETPGADHRSRSWVFRMEEVPAHVTDALEESGYHYTSKSAHPRATSGELGQGDEDDTWRERALRYSQTDHLITAGELSVLHSDVDEEGTQIAIGPKDSIEEFHFVVEGDEIRFEYSVNHPSECYSDLPGRAQEFIEDKFWWAEPSNTGSSKAAVGE